MKSVQLTCLLDDLDRAGVTLEVRSGRLWYFPASGVSPAMRSGLTKFKGLLIDMLAHTGGRHPVRSGACHSYILGPIEPLLAQTRQDDPDMADQYVEEWRERVALCEIHGRLDPVTAELVAFRELLAKLAYNASVRYAGRHEHATRSDEGRDGRVSA